MTRGCLDYALTPPTRPGGESSAPWRNLRIKRSPYEFGFTPGLQKQRPRQAGRRRMLWGRFFRWDEARRSNRQTQSEGRT